MINRSYIVVSTTASVLRIVLLPMLFPLCVLRRCLLFVMDAPANFRALRTYFVLPRCFYNVYLRIYMFATRALHQPIALYVPMLRYSVLHPMVSLPALCRYTTVPNYSPTVTITMSLAVRTGFNDTAPCSTVL